jgi:hypothetical protein
MGNAEWGIRSPENGVHRAKRLRGQNVMREKGRPFPAPRASLIIGLGLLTAGCAQELGPVPMPVTRVQGVVREGRRPVSGGWVEFFPVGGTVGNLRSARLYPDGSFEADRVAVGENLIRLVNARIDSPAASRLFSSFSSPIRREISERSGEPITVDLLEEWVRFERSKTRDASHNSSGTGQPR